MEIKKQMLRVLSIGLMLSSVGSLHAEQVGRIGQMRDKISQFQNSLIKSFRTTWDRYNRCIRGKCSDEEKQRVKQELKAAAKKTVKYGAIVAGIILAALVLGKVVARLRAKSAMMKVLKVKYNIMLPADSWFMSFLVSSSDPDNISKSMQMFGLGMKDVTRNGRLAGAEIYYGHEPNSDEFYEFETKFFGDHKPVPAAGIIPAEVIGATYPPMPGEDVPVVQPMGAPGAYEDVD